MRRSKLAVASSVAETVGLAALMRRLPTWEGVAAIAYHRIGDGSDSLYDRATWEASAERFAEQMAFVKKSFDVISPADVQEIARTGRRGRHLLITFDDAYTDAYEHAYPTLRSLGLPATFFVTTGFVDRREVAWWDEISWLVRTSERPSFRLPGFDEELSTLPGERGQVIGRLIGHHKTLPRREGQAFIDAIAEATGRPRLTPADYAPWMSWDQLREIRDAGMTIGGHTDSHPILSRCTHEEQEHEIATCKARLEAETGEPMRYFSYPNGTPDSFDDSTRALLIGAGVELSFSYYGGFYGLGEFDPYDVPRRAVVQGSTMPMFQMALTLPHLRLHW